MRNCSILLILLFVVGCSSAGGGVITGNYFLKKSPYGYTANLKSDDANCVDLAADQDSIEILDDMVGDNGKEFHIVAKSISGRSIAASEHGFEGEVIRSGAAGLMWKGRFFGLECECGRLYEIKRFQPVD